MLIDSNIWYHAYILSEKEEFKEIHNKAVLFLAEKLNNDSVIIALTSYQVVEIMELLRKGQVDRGRIKELFDSFNTDKFQILEVSFEDISHCIHKSLISGIHAYDYLVALPLKGIISVIYSSDDHFQHPDFKEIASVVNPISPWILREGKVPQRS